MSETDFKSWAIVQQMGHVSYAGYVTIETIAGVAMIRVDVPDVPPVGAFTKYIHPGSLYDLTPVSEETARARAATRKSSPVESWDLQKQIIDNLRAQGRLIENKPAELKPVWPADETLPDAEDEHHDE
jgi:hypothetical protein